MIPAALLLEGYRRGIFPMSVGEGEIKWFSPNPRAIIPLDAFHVPHGLARTLRKNLFEVRIDTRFSDVIRACAARDDTWIDDEIIASYVELHRLGFAHSVEAWRDGALAGGLYGVAIGGAFFGESMFHWQTDASKVALHALVERLNARGFSLLDTQWQTRNLQQFGTTEIAREDYLERLSDALLKECLFP